MRSHHPASLALAAAGLLLLACATGAGRPAPRESAMQRSTVHDFSVRTSDGHERSLAEFRGRVLLIVNTASRCGFTPQYEGLQALYDTYHARGFEVLAFPSNDFMGQEPGTDAEIARFCSTRFHTTFPLFSKLSVRGKRMAPLYRWLTRDSEAPGDIPWNFTKFLVDGDGHVVARFGPSTEPRSPQVVAALEKLLPPLE